MVQAHPLPQINQFYFLIQGLKSVSSYQKKRCVRKVYFVMSRVKKWRKEHKKNVQSEKVSHYEKLKSRIYCVIKDYGYNHLLLHEKILLLCNYELTEICNNKSKYEKSESFYRLRNAIFSVFTSIGRHLTVYNEISNYLEDYRKKNRL